MKTMGFFDSLKRVLEGDKEKVSDRVAAAWNLRDTSEHDQPAFSEPEPFHGGEYDKKSWRKKLKRILDDLPESQPEWADHIAEAHALGIGNVELATWSRDEFALLVRRVVADRMVTEAEHRKLDLARELLEIPDAEAEAILHEIVEEAEKFFGKRIEGA
jgi:hypothetical protein